VRSFWAMVAPARKRIIDATLEALVETGPEDLTMSDVAHRAGLSVGTLYLHFADKKEMVSSAHDQFLAQIETGSDFSAIPLDADESTFIRGLAAQLLGLLQRHEQLLRAFIVQAALDPYLHDRASQQTRALSRAFKSRLMLKRDSFGNGASEIAADVCFRLIYDTASRRSSHGATFSIALDVSWAQLEIELSRACAAYLAADRAEAMRGWDQTIPQADLAASS
jgi:AcrR family transcriptional regulator